MSASLTMPSLPESLVWTPPMTDDEFEAFCLANDNIQFERTKEGVIRVNPPAGPFTGDGNSEIIYQLRAWWKTHRKGRVFDSNTGFFLPDGSMCSPDAAYVLPEKLAGLTREAGTHFLRQCPDFVIELLSASDSKNAARARMLHWIANGASLGWLVDPYQRKVGVYQPGHEELMIAVGSIQGSGPVQGFTLDLTEVWSCYEQ